MYHILGFIAVILGLVFIWTVGTYDYKLGVYFQQIYAAVILFFMLGLFMLAKRFLRNPDERGREKEAAGSYEERKANVGREFFLFSDSEGETISYRVENEEKEAVFDAVGKLAEGRVDSLKIRAQKQDAWADILVTREQSAKAYIVREGEQFIGTIKVRKAGVSFCGVDGSICFSTSFADEDVPEEEEAVAGIMTLVTLRTFSEAKANILLIKGPGDEVMGKYYLPLRNLELICDRSDIAGRNIAIVMAIMADLKYQIKESRNRL